MFGNLRLEVDEDLSKVWKMEGIAIIKVATLSDHVHMYVSIPPEEGVVKVVGRIKRKGSLRLFDREPELQNTEGLLNHFATRKQLT